VDHPDYSGHQDHAIISPYRSQITQENAIDPHDPSVIKITSTSLNLSNKAALTKI
jgi:hypothetical protein